MDRPAEPRTCPDCDEPLFYTFHDTAGVGAWKLGDGFATTPDTAHYVCFACAKCWKQRLDGPLTPDMIGDIAFFTCRHADCGRTLVVTHESTTATEVRLACAARHEFAVVDGDAGGLTIAEATA
jgi:hypothetical protein